MINRRNIYHVLAHWLLWLYPAAWRDRYGEEMAAVLRLHPVSLWTIFDLGLGAIDAQLRRDLLPNRLVSDDQRLRTSEVAILCAFVLFFVPWLALQRIRDPLPVWEHAVFAHPEIRLAFSVVQLTGGIALLAILIGGVPLLVTSILQAVARRHWHVVRLFLVPLVALCLLAGYAGLASPYWSQTVPNTPPTGPLTPLAIVLQLGLAVLVGLTIITSTGAIAVAVANSQLNVRLLRFTMLPATLATAAISVGLLVTVVLVLLSQREATEPGVSDFLGACLILLMGSGAALAITALCRGLTHASRPTGNAANV